MLSCFKEENKSEKERRRKNRLSYGNFRRRFSETIGSAPFLRSNFHKCLQDCLAFRMLLRTAGQLSPDWCNIRPRYLNESTPLANSAPSFPVRLKVVSVPLFDISTSRLRHLICILMSHIDVRRCLMIRTDVNCTTHKSQPGSGSAPS